MSFSVLKEKDLIRIKKKFLRYLPDLTKYFPSQEALFSSPEGKEPYFVHQVPTVLKSNRNISMGLSRSQGISVTVL